MDFQASPSVKFEASPAESFLSAPNDEYPSLFAVSTPSSGANTMNPMEMMTPQSFSEDKQNGTLSPVPEDSALASEDMPADAATPSADGDKKPTKKRKSWGQVLPEPKTNLPPRKRAKTEDEKEQRRVERVLRNRRAAQSSWAPTRLEVEALEQRNKQLEELLVNAQKTNLMLVEELNRFRRNSGVVTRSSSPLDSLRDNPVTLSQDLFGSQEISKNTTGQSGHPLMDDVMNPTVNPASLSPALSPVPDSINEAEDKSEDAKSTEQNEASSTDLTQRPAEMLCDLQCQSSVKTPTSLPASQTTASPLLILSLQLRMIFLSASAILSACQRPLTQIAISSKAGFSLLPYPQLLTTIIWLVTIPPASRINLPSTSSTSRTSSTMEQTLWQRATMPLRTTASTARSTTLRLKSLRKILSSSPNLARPLLDATMVALRLVSEGCDIQVGTSRCESDATREFDCELTQCLRAIALPPKEVLLALSWALTVELRKIERNGGVYPEPKSRSPVDPTKSLLSNTASIKRRREDGAASGGARYYKRSRLA